MLTFIGLLLNQTIQLLKNEVKMLKKKIKQFCFYEGNNRDEHMWIQVAKEDINKIISCYL